MHDILSRSPERFTFQRESYLRRQEESGVDESDPAVISMLDYYDQMLIEQNKKELDPEWKKNNMEYDLRSTEWILNKVRSSDAYAQNLYAALCNNDFQKVSVEDTPENVVNLLRDGPVTWSCSWRYAGGIVADMQEKGDYIDWYCSGIRDNREIDDDQFQQMNKENQERYLETKKYVGESVVTDEIREDLLKLGWRVVQEDETEI